MPAMGIGALTPWLEREFLSQRNQHGDALPNDSPRVDPKRVQLITATGTTTENGEELVWTEVADGQFWIHCCFPRDLVNQFDSSNARAKPFSSYSATKGLFRLVQYRFVLARPLIPPRASPRKQQHAPKQEQQQPRLRSLRVCLRVDEFQLYSQGQGSLLGDYQDFRKWVPVAATAPGREDGPSKTTAKERVEWVSRIECGGDDTSKMKQQHKDEADSGAATKVEFLQDLQGASDPKPRFRKPSPPPAAGPGMVDPPLAAPFFPPLASTSNTNPPPLAPGSSLLPRHRLIPSVRDGVPPYVPTATWPDDAQPIVKIDWREGEERIQQRAMAPPPVVVVETKREEEESKEKKVVIPLERGRDARDPRRVDKEKEEEEQAEVEMLLLGGTGLKPNSPTKEIAVSAAVAVAVETAKPIKVDWSSVAEKLQQRQRQQQRPETRTAAVQARPSKPPTTTIVAPSAASSSPSRRLDLSPAGQKSKKAEAAAAVVVPVEPRAGPNPNQTRIRTRTSPQQRQPRERARADVGPESGPGTGAGAEASAAAMREKYEAPWRVEGKDGPDGEGKVSSPPPAAPAEAQVAGADSGGKADALGVATPPRVPSNVDPAPDSALSTGQAQAPLPDLAKPDRLNDMGDPTNPVPLNNLNNQGQLFSSAEPAVGGVTADAVLGASVTDDLADTLERRAHDEDKPPIAKTGTVSSTTSGPRAGPSTTQGVAAPRSFHGDTNTRAAAEKRMAALAAARRAGGLDAKRRRDELEEDQDALNRPRQPKLDERHVSPSHRTDDASALLCSSSPTSPAAASMCSSELEPLAGSELACTSSAEPAPFYRHRTSRVDVHGAVPISKLPAASGCSSELAPLTSPESACTSSAEPAPVYRHRTSRVDTYNTISSSPAAMTPSSSESARMSSVEPARMDRRGTAREESILSQDLAQSSSDPSNSDDEGCDARPGPVSEANPSHHSRKAQGTLEDPNWALLRHMQGLAAAERVVRASQMSREAAIRAAGPLLSEVQGERVFGGVSDGENKDEHDQELAELVDNAKEDEDVEAEQEEEAARLHHQREVEAEKAAFARAQRVVDGKERNKRGRNELADDYCDDDSARVDHRHKWARAAVATAANLKADGNTRGFGDTLKMACLSDINEINETTQVTSADEDEEMQDVRLDVRGSERAPINPHVARTSNTRVLQDDQMHFASSGATTAEAISSSVSPDRLLSTRRDRAEPIAVNSAPSTAAAAAIIQDLGQVLIDSAQLAASPSTAAAKSQHSPPKRPQKVTWRIKPELFDFGLWCRANEITA